MDDSLFSARPDSSNDQANEDHNKRTSNNGANLWIRDTAARYVFWGCIGYKKT